MISLKIIGKLSDSLQKEILEHSDLLNEKVIGFFVDYCEKSIPLLQSFDIIFFNDEHEKVDCKLVYITNQLLIPYDIVEEGYKTICFFYFKSKTCLINKIPTVSNWYDYDALNNNKIVFAKNKKTC